MVIKYDLLTPYIVVVFQWEDRYRLIEDSLIGTLFSLIFMT